MFIVHKSKLAEKDLINIWRYSLENWGITQADLYLDHIEDALQSIRANPNIGIDCTQTRRSYRKFKINEHFIWYTVKTNKITVVRVLHKSMDYLNRI